MPLLPSVAERRVTYVVGVLDAGTEVVRPDGRLQLAKPCAISNRHLDQCGSLTL